MENQQSHSLTSDSVNPSVSRETWTKKLFKMDFWKSPRAIITIIILASLVIAGVLFIVYNIGLNNRKNTEGGESGIKMVKTEPSLTPTSTPGTISDATATPSNVDNSTPTPTPTQPQGTSTPTSTPTQPRNTSTPTPTPTQPRSTSTPTPTPNPKRFTVGERFYDPNSNKYKIQIKLDNEVIKDLIDPDGCDPDKLDYLPVPVTSSDRTKVYYIDPSEPTSVKEINNNKEERVFFNPAQAGYKYVAGLAVNSRDQMGYTLLKDTSEPCMFGNGPIPKSAFYINSRLIGYSGAVIEDRDAKFEIITYLGDNYFLTDVIYEVTPIGDPKFISLRATSNGSRVELYGRNPTIFYRNVSRGLVILTIGYPSSEEDEPPTDDRVVRIELNGNGKSDLLNNEQKNKMIKNIEVRGMLKITYGIYEERYSGWVLVDTRTDEYSL